ncbi:carbohydrate-binding protein [Formosa sp. 4Alg 33]|uniref:carbohydrate-binding protein n=1 Tax=Formosa sp. 4Alg 33 TaxID=3382189 RepID=UPI003D9C44AD
MKRITLLVLLSCFLSFNFTEAQTAINSLSELKDRLDDDDGNFKMTPGTYYFNTNNCGPGKLFPDADILFFTGSHSTFDFTDVKFEFDSAIFAEAYSGWSVQFWPVGDNNVYLNLTMEIIGNRRPNSGGEAIHLDGADNRIEGFHITQRSSYPYGYGDIFGKGGGSVIAHGKRAGILVRGDRNHIKGCTLIMRSYGHGIFMQGANDALIEDCYVEGELRTVGEVLQEEGTGSPADEVDFQTVWGYDLRDLQSDYRFSLQEDGIRAYTQGTPYGGEERPTTGTQVKNCTVVKMRSGVTIGWDYTDKVVENCKVLACETGFWFGSKTIATNCSGDGSVGPLVSEDVGRSNSTIDVTILDNYVPKIGNTPYMYFAGNDHNLTLHDGTTTFNSDIELQVGGKRYAHRWLEGSDEAPLERDANNLTFKNNTKYPVTLEYNVSNTDLTTCGSATDNGTNNSISRLDDCIYERPCENTAENLQAECYDDMENIGIRDIPGDLNEREVYAFDSGDWIAFNTIDLTAMSAIEVVALSDFDNVTLEVRQDSPTGTLLANISLSKTDAFTTFSADLNEMVNGKTDIYFVAKSENQNDWLFALDRLAFIEDACLAASYNPVFPISAETFCSSSDVTTEDLTPFNKVVSSIENSDYIKYANIDFGVDDHYNTIDIIASSVTTGSAVEVRSGAVDGTLLATIAIANTGSWNNYETFSSFTHDELTGTQDIYFVFTGGSGSLLRVDSFSFYYDNSASNLALASKGSIATQSSTAHDGEASRAIDGNTNGNFGGGSVTHTEDGGEGTLKWWQVDMQGNKTIEEIIIYNRTGYEDRLNNYTVEVRNSKDEIVYSQLFPSYPDPVATIAMDGIVGQVVRVSKTSDRALTIAEVEVHGSNTLSTTDAELGAQIKVFPNPTTDIIRVSNAIDTTLEIYNIQGVLEMTVDVKGSNEVISLGHLSAGIHLLKFTNKLGSSVKKLIKK